MRVLNATQMREADRLTIEEIGVPSIVLMENAGRQVVGALEARFEKLVGQRVVVLCGCGNNGGDGFVIARTLKQREIDAAVFLVGAVRDVQGDARCNLNILGQIGMPVVEIPDEQAWELHYSEIAGFDVIVDAILGTGIKVPLIGVLQTLVADINELEIPVVSVDLPTGLSADTHDVVGEAMKAALTVTMGAPKVSLLLPPAEMHAGDLVVADVGIPRRVIDELEGPRLEVITRESVRRFVGTRQVESHKGDFGHVLFVAGSAGKTGAASLAAAGAVKSGVGLVTVATPRSSQAVVASYAADFMTEGLAETPDGCVDLPGLERVLGLPSDVIAIGPGLGKGSSVSDFVHGLLTRSGVPLVCDADALNACAVEDALLCSHDGIDVIITPHPGEMARLQGTTVEDVQANRIEAARSFAIGHGVHVVLKGHRTVIACPNGHVFLNVTGNPGMATGGTGDVLTGVIAAWFAQLLDAEAACKIGVYLHGLAGDLAVVEKGEVAMSASDLVPFLGNAVLDLAGREGVDVEG